MSASVRSSTGIRPQVRTVDGLSIRFAESGRDGVDALLLSPWPESLFAYDRVWSRLAERAHLVAVDLPGYGRSERREALLSPRAMGEFVISLADAFQLDHPHCVGPDVAVGAVLFAAAQHPSRFRSLVVGGGGVAVPIELGGALHDWVFAPDLEPFRHMDPATIVAAALDTIHGYTLPDDVRRDYLASYAGDRFVESMRYVRAYHQDLPVLRDLLPTIQTPVQIFAGRQDRAVPVANAQYLYDRLPHRRQAYLDTGHFVWEEDGAGFAALVRDWWDGGYATVAAEEH
jgi:pimeloyl-ACP methyl ester carboxylesterase